MIRSPLTSATVDSTRIVCVPGSTQPTTAPPVLRSRPAAIPIPDPLAFEVEAEVGKLTLIPVQPPETVPRVKSTLACTILLVLFQDVPLIVTVPGEPVSHVTVGVVGQT